MVGAIAQEFVDQVTIGTMNFYTIEARFFGIEGREAKALDNGWDFRVLKNAWHDVRFFPLGRMHFIVLDGERAGRYGLRAVV